MVLRLFVPPGEGQHKLVPKRPDPLGANAALQYSLLSSTAVAAAYTSVASIHAQRVAPSQPVSRAALFIRSSARLGLWAGVVGATLNYYYYSAFANVVILQKNPTVKPWKLYKWTKSFTIEDGALMGAGLGLAASIPTLFLRRISIPRWTRCLGLTNIGASTGVLAAHAYLEYTGERQKAYKRLDRRLKRRSLEFWAIFWDKKLMAQFDPLIQQYVRHNGLWYTHRLPNNVYEQPDAYGRKTLKNKVVEGQQAEEKAYYNEAFDYAEDLKRINVAVTHAKMAELEAERETLLAEAEYVLFVAAQKEYDYCHWEPEDEAEVADERQRRMREIHLLEIAYNRLRSAALTIDIKLVKWRLSLQHKAQWCVSEDDRDLVYTDDVVADWLPAKHRVDGYRHSPTLSLAELEKFQTQIAAEVKRFEELVANKAYEQSRRERWKKDLEDGRVLLSAVDRLVWDFEGRRRALEGTSIDVVAGVEKVEIEGVEGDKGLKKEEQVETPSPPEEKKPNERTQVEKKEKNEKPGNGSLDSDRS